MDAASPTHTVDTSDLTYLMVSKTAIPASIACSPSGAKAAWTAGIVQGNKQMASRRQSMCLMHVVQQSLLEAISASAVLLSMLAILEQSYRNRSSETCGSFQGTRYALNRQFCSAQCVVSRVSLCQNHVYRSAMEVDA